MRAALLFLLASRWLPPNGVPPAVEEVGGPIATAPAIAVTADGATLLAWESSLGPGRWIEFRRREPGDTGAWSDGETRLDGAPDQTTALEPRLAVDGQTTLLAWQDNRDGAFGIFARRSTDGGRTWPSLETRVDTMRGGASVDGESLAGPSSMVSIALLNGGACLAAYETQQDGVRDIHVRRGADGGATWSANETRLDSGDGASYHPQVALLGGTSALALWWDESNGLSDLMTRRSADGGATWEGPVRLDPGDAGAFASRDAAFAARGPLVVVAWEDEAGGIEREIHVRRSEDGGATWGEETRLGRPRWARAIEDPRIAIDARGRAHVSWVTIPRDEPPPAPGPLRVLAKPVHRPDPTAALFHAAIDSAGVVLSLTQVPSAGPHSKLVVLEAGGDALWIAWVGTRIDGAALDAACSTDDGLTWRSVGLPRSQNPSGEFIPVTALVGVVNPADGALHLAWVSGRSERERLFFARVPIPLARGSGRD